MPQHRAVPEKGAVLFRAGFSQPATHGRFQPLSFTACQHDSPGLCVVKVVPFALYFHASRASVHRGPTAVKSPSASKGKGRSGFLNLLPVVGFTNARRVPFRIPGAPVPTDLGKSGIDGLARENRVAKMMWQEWQLETHCHTPEPDSGRFFQCLYKRHEDLYHSVKRDTGGGRMRLVRFLMAALLISVAFQRCSSEGQWTSLFDGQDLKGWRASEDESTFRVEDGAIVCNGRRAHLFYVGDVSQANFKNFEFEAEVKTTPGSNPAGPRRDMSARSSIRIGSSRTAPSLNTR